MKYELDVLAALTQLPQPTTLEIVAATGISERKVQGVIKDLQLNLEMQIEKVKKGRSLSYVVTDWGVFESGLLLKKSLAARMQKVEEKPKTLVTKSAFYNSVKMKNYKESARLEGMSIPIKNTPVDKKSISKAKRSLIEKYSKYKNMSNNYGG